MTPAPSLFYKSQYTSTSLTGTLFNATSHKNVLSTLQGRKYLILKRAITYSLSVPGFESRKMGETGEGDQIIGGAKNISWINLGNDWGKWVVRGFTPRKRIAPNSPIFKLLLLSLLLTPFVCQPFFTWNTFPPWNVLGGVSWVKGGLWGWGVVAVHCWK